MAALAGRVERQGQAKRHRGATKISGWILGEFLCTSSMHRHHAHNRWRAGDRTLLSRGLVALRILCCACTAAPRPECFLHRLIQPDPLSCSEVARRLPPSARRLVDRRRQTPLTLPRHQLGPRLCAGHVSPEQVYVAECCLVLWSVLSVLGALCQCASVCTIVCINVSLCV